MVFTIGLKYCCKKTSYQRGLDYADSILYIYIYIVLFGPVKPELGVIPSEQENYSKMNI